MRWRWPSTGSNACTILAPHVHVIHTRSFSTALFGSPQRAVLEVEGIEGGGLAMRAQGISGLR